MNFSTKHWFIVALLLVAVAAWTQEPYHKDESGILAKLSYERSPVVERAGVRHVCISVSRDGEYRIIRSVGGQPLTERLQGKLPHEQLEKLKKMLKSSAFRGLTDHGGLIRQEAESFAAEIPLGDRLREDGSGEWVDHPAWRLHWLNGDGESPFPDSVEKVVDWLSHFQPKNAKSFEYADYPDVCPAGGLRLVQPAVAENQQP